MYYTGIGSRETPATVCDKMIRIGQILAVRNHILRSGGADGADKAFETGHLLANENMEIYIPWKKFVSEVKDYHRLSMDNKVEAQAEEIASKTHPAWNKCTPGAKKLHTRNIYQVLGSDLTTPSSFLICWTKDGKDVGGTRTAITLARQNNVPVFNLYDYADKEPMDILKIISKNITGQL